MRVVKLGEVGVDSASLLITDPTYLSRWVHDDPFAVTKDLNNAIRHPCPEGLPYSLGGSTAAHCSSDHGGPVGNGSGVAVSTGYGDGLYPVYAEITEAEDLDPDTRAFGIGRVARVIIDFEIVERQDFVWAVVGRPDPDIDPDIRDRAWTVND